MPSTLAQLARVMPVLVVGFHLISVSPCIAQTRVTTHDDLRRGLAPGDFIMVDAIQSLERPRDSGRNGAAIGAAIGAGVGGALFVRAVVIDRNEMDEWAPLYVGAAAVCTGIGALIGWAIDAANSKPHIRSDASTAGRTRVRVEPVVSRGRGIALTVSF